MSSTPVVFQGYRAIVAINNIGVSLLERGHYLQARHTFKDAIAILQHTCALIESKTDAMESCVASTQIALQSKVAAATARFEAVKEAPPRQHCLSAVSVQPIPHRPGQPMTLPTSLRDQLELAPGDRYTCYPTRIEIEDFGFCPTLSQLKVSSSSLLCNYAAAYICQAAISTCTQSFQHLCNLAMSILALAHKPVSRTSQQQHSCELSDPQRAAEQLQLEVLVLLATLRLLRATGAQERAETVKGHLESLLRVAADLDTHVRTFFEAEVVSAAAA